MKTNEPKLKRGPVIGKQELRVLIFTKMAAAVEKLVSNDLPGAVSTRVNRKRAEQRKHRERSHYL